MVRLWGQPGGKALVLALVALVGTALVAFWNVDNRHGTVCGSWLAPNMTHARLADTQENTERSQRALRDALMESSGRLDVPVRGSRAESSTAQVEACEAARSARTPLVIVFAAATIVLFAAGVVMRQRPTG